MGKFSHINPTDIPVHSKDIPARSDSFLMVLVAFVLRTMKKVAENSKWTSALPLGVYLTFVSHVSHAQDLQYGRDNDGDRYVFYPFKGDHLKGEFFKNERSMFALFLHFQTSEIHTPDHPQVEVHIKNELGEAIIRPMTMEYIHNALTDISTLSIALEQKDFETLKAAKEVLFFTMETTDKLRLSFINIPDEERKIIPETARKIEKVEFKD